MEETDNEFDVTRIICAGHVIHCISSTSSFIMVWKFDAPTDFSSLSDVCASYSIVYMQLVLFS